MQFKQKALLYSLTFIQLKRDCQWLIPGHVALTKIKCIPIVIHLSKPLSGYIRARDQSMVESGVTEDVKNTACFFFFFSVNEHNTNIKRQAEKERFLKLSQKRNSS